MIPATIANQQKLEADLAQAEKTLAANPKDAEAIIWVGRRLGYLWRYNDAIAMFSKGIALLSRTTRSSTATAAIATSPSGNSPRRRPTSRRRRS